MDWSTSPTTSSSTAFYQRLDQWHFFPTQQTSSFTTTTRAVCTAWPSGRGVQLETQSIWLLIIIDYWLVNHTFKQGRSINDAINWIFFRHNKLPPYRTTTRTVHGSVRSVGQPNKAPSPVEWSVRSVGQPNKAPSPVEWSYGWGLLPINVKWNPNSQTVWSIHANLFPSLNYIQFS